MGKNKKKMMNPDSGGPQHSPATVFVNNLPYTFSNAQLEETFSDVGPIRRCFMVTQKGSSEHRGFGYVHFAVTEDANRAIELKNGSSVGGRTVGVKHAMHRPSLEQRRSKGTEVVPSTIKANGGKDDFVSDSIKTVDGKENSLFQSADTIKTKDDKDESSKPVQKRKQSMNSQEIGKTDKKKEVKPMKAELVEGDSSTLIVKPKKAPNSQDKGKIDKKKEVNPVKAELVEGDSSTPIVKPKTAPNSQDKGKSDKTKKAMAPLKTERVDGTSSEKQRVARTVIIGGILNNDMAEDVHRHARECGSVSSITYPLSKEEITHHGLLQDGCRLGASSIVYDSVKSARACVTKLHQKSLSGGTVWARQLGGEGSKVQKWKLIIRNLPFKATINEIKEMFASAGFVWDVYIPKKPDSALSRGFAFVKFTCKQDAETAIQKFNGNSFGKRPIAVDWAVPKNIYTADAQVAQKDDQEESDDEEDFNRDLEDDNAEMNSNTHHSHGDADVSDGSDLVKEEVNFDDEADVTKKVLNNLLSLKGPVAPVNDDFISVQKKKDDGIVNLPNKESESLTKNESSAKTEKTNIKPVETEEELERTLFICNLPFDITNDEIKQRFTGFGEIQSFVPVLHPVTKRPRGTGFLKFKTLDAADAAFAAATSVAGLGIILKGRQLKVLKALNKKAAHDKEVEKTKKEEIDHRNLYLAKEGLILEGTPAAEGVSDSDMSKRRSLEQKKATKLKSPNFHVSRTRLIMYNVPKAMNEKQLKRLCLDAVTSRATKQKPTIRQIKLLKDSVKGKEVSKNHSRGVAFIEFTEHQHALVALRVLNNNPETFTAEHRPIVEFALDNVQTLRQRNDKIEAQQQGFGNDVESTNKKTDFHKPADRSNDMSRKRKTPDTLQESRNTKGMEAEPKPNMKKHIDSKKSLEGQQGKRKKGHEAAIDKITSGTVRPTRVAVVPMKKRTRDQKEIQIEDKTSKRRKNKDPLGQDTVDKLDMLIEQYTNKFSGNRTNKNDGEKQGSKRLGRWFQT
uniref:RNA-binding protein 28 n=1 Tax=Erigeron canadensis TaxID=72917 RepID=UPI001CB93CFF|nr:RNA-binding protein 28 [Erigeron canadensis]